MDWKRPEFQGREAELETREEFAKRTGVSAQSLSSHFTRYANRIPKPAAMFGKQKYFVAVELDGFMQWIFDNSGTRSDAEVKAAEVARLEIALEDVEERISKHQASLAKAERDKARFARNLHRAKSDLEFLRQGG